MNEMEQSVGQRAHEQRTRRAVREEQHTGGTAQQRRQKGTITGQLGTQDELGIIGSYLQELIADVAHESRQEERSAAKRGRHGAVRALMDEATKGLLTEIAAHGVRWRNEREQTIRDGLRVYYGAGRVKREVARQGKAPCEAELASRELRKRTEEAAPSSHATRAEERMPIEQEGTSAKKMAPRRDTRVQISCGAGRTPRETARQGVSPHKVRELGLARRPGTRTEEGTQRNQAMSTMGNRPQVQEPTPSKIATPRKVAQMFTPTATHRLHVQAKKGARGGQLGSGRGSRAGRRGVAPRGSAGWETRARAMKERG